MTKEEYDKALKNEEIDRLNNIINEAKEECKSVIEDSEHTTISEFNINGLMRTILNILNKAENNGKSNKMKKMIYQKDRKIELLYQGKYKGYKYYILNLGTHPTAYIEIPKNNALFKKHYDKIDLNVHGGLTYSESILSISENEKAEGEWFIGWDYAHCNDYAGFYDEMDFISRYYNLKKWTTEEIKQECENAIDELKDMGNKYE